jgi:murein DD-endopeptidase MepM/ murein hydrolase activator NlpD
MVAGQTNRSPACPSASHGVLRWLGQGEGQPDNVESPARSLDHRLTVRAVVAVIVLALVATLTALDASTATATDIGAARRGQSYWESVMLQADRLVNRLSRGRSGVRRDVNRANRALRKIKSRRAKASRIVRAHAATVRHLERKLPPEGEEVPAWIARKIRVAERQYGRAKQDQARLSRMTARVLRTRAAKQRRMKQYRRVLRGAVGRQRAAEGALGGLIVSATRLAQQRAELKTYVQLGTPGSFVWPSGGSITQGYGCTRVAFYAPRGSCRHFHDGLDISPSAGTRIGSVATGVVAYAGWNPWDGEGRAFIVVIGHADGYVSRYGHLVPNRRVARAGQVVYRGQTIGYMGSTGMSTGVHLHLELLRGGSTIDPTSVLPDRGDGGKVSKDKKKGKGTAKAAKGKRKGGDARRKGGDRRGGKGKRADARDERRERDQREDERVTESAAPTIAASSGLTLADDPDPDVCSSFVRASVPSPRDRDADDPPTLSDLAEQLRIAAGACDVELEEPAVDGSWPSGQSPWDLSVFDEGDAAAAR